MSEKNSPFTRTDVWIALGVAVAAIVFQWPIHDRWLALLDEGYVLSIADYINRGLVPYRDVTIDAPFPAAFYLLAWWFRLTGTSVESSRLLVLGAFALYAVAFYRIARALLPRTWSLALVVLLFCYRLWAFPHWQFYSYSLVAATLATVATALVFVAVRAGTTLPLLAAGAVAGLATLSKQDYGGSVSLALAAALLVIAWLQERRGWLRSVAPAFFFGLGAAAVVVPAFLHLIANGALDAMIQQTIVFPFEVMGKASYPRLPALWPPWGRDEALRAGIGNYFPSILATLWWNECPGCWASDLGQSWAYRSTWIWDVTLKLAFWAPLLLTLLALVLWIRRLVAAARNGSPDPQAAPRILTLAFAIGFLLSFNPPRDWVHLMMVYPPTALLLGAVLARDASVAVGRLPAFGLRAVLGAAALAALVVTIALMSDLRDRVDHWIGDPRGRVYADRSNGPLLDDVIAWSNRSVPPAVPMPVYPMQPMIGFLAGRSTVAGYHVIWPHQTAERDRRIVEALDAQDVRYLVFSLSQWGHLQPFQANAAHLFDALVEGWEIDQVFSREWNGPIVVSLKRRPAGSRHTTSLQSVAVARDAAWTRWPFDEVLTHAVGTTDESAARIELTVPEDRPFVDTAFGMNPDRWYGPPTGPITFEAFVEAPPGGERRSLVRQTIDPRSVVADRHWFPVTFDLSAEAGRPVTLVLTASVETIPPESADLVGWRDPELRGTRQRRSRGRSPSGEDPQAVELNRGAAGAANALRAIAPGSKTRPPPAAR
ncbi:MAG: hypothetical protein FJ144_00465 [Deltaproteobacteria bacterium]|nr:hypothetical protein [Deltaproteobacteria bacterium]